MPACGQAGAEVQSIKILAEISVGELIDKLTILEIKLDHIGDPAQRRNLAREFNALATTLAHEALTGDVEDAGRIPALRTELKSVNARLWQVEDDLRRLERDKRFDEQFIALARSVYQINDRRAQLKRVINEITRSEIVEEKSYEAY